MKKENNKELELKYLKRFPDEREDVNQDIFLERPADIECDDDGNIYVSDGMANCLFKFDRSGMLIKTIGKKGQGPGELIRPNSIALGGKNIYVQDLGNSRFVVFDKNGNYVRNIKIFLPVNSIGANDDEKIYTSRMYSAFPREKDKFINVISIQGNLLQSFGDPLKERSDFSISNLSNIDVDHEGNVIVVYDYLPVVRKYSPFGKIILEKRISDEFIDKYDKENARTYKESIYRAIFSDVKAVGERIFILVSPHESVSKIYEIDSAFQIKKIYSYDFKKKQKKNYVRKFAMMEEAGRKLFYLLDLEDDAVYVFDQEY